MTLNSDTHTKDQSKDRDINKEPSKKKGFWGWLESFLRTFVLPTYIITILLTSIAYILAIGTSLAPGIYLYQIVSDIFQSDSLLLKSFLLGCTIGVGFVLFILVLIFIVPILNAPVLPFIKPARGPWFSLESIPWFYHNSMTYLVRYTILNRVSGAAIGS